MDFPFIIYDCEIHIIICNTDYASVHGDIIFFALFAGRIRVIKQAFIYSKASIADICNFSPTGDMYIICYSIRAGVSCFSGIDTGRVCSIRNTGSCSTCVFLCNSGYIIGFLLNAACGCRIGKSTGSYHHSDKYTGNDHF